MYSQRFHSYIRRLNLAQNLLFVDDTLYGLAVALKLFGNNIDIVFLAVK